MSEQEKEPTDYDKTLQALHALVQKQARDAQGYTTNQGVFDSLLKATQALEILLNNPPPESPSTEAPSELSLLLNQDGEQT